MRVRIVISTGGDREGGGKVGDFDMCDYQSATANKTTVFRNNHLLKKTLFEGTWILHRQYSPPSIWFPSMFSSNNFAAATVATGSASQFHWQLSAAQCLPLASQ